MIDLYMLQLILLEMSWLLSTGGIHARYRAITFSLDELNRSIYVNFYIDGKVSEFDEADITISIETLQKSIEKNTTLQYEYITNIQQLDFPKELPINEYLVYLRDESRFESKKCTPPKIDPALYCAEELNILDALQLLINYSLLGRVRPNLRYVGCSLNEKKKIAYFFIYYDGSMSKKDIKVAEKIIEEAMAHFDGTYTAQIEIEEIEYPRTCPSLGTTIYKRNEHIFKHKYSLCPKIWVNVQNHEAKTLKITSDSFDSLLSSFRFNLLGNIRPNCRSVQYTINRENKKGCCWFHYSDGPTEDIMRIANKYKQLAATSQFDLDVFVVHIARQALIPRYGHFLFMRDDLANTIPLSTVTDYKKVTDFVTKQIPVIWKDNAPRAVLIDAHELNNKVIFYFVYREIVSRDDASNAAALLEKIKNEVFPNFSCIGIYAHYHQFEVIPKVGFAAYLDEEEATTERIFLNMYIPEALAGKIRPQLVSVKANLDFIKKIAYYWFYYDANHELTIDDEKDIIDVVIASTPAGYVHRIEKSFLKPYEQEPSIGWFVYRRYEPEDKNNHNLAERVHHQATAVLDNLPQPVLDKWNNLSEHKAVRLQKSHIKKFRKPM